MTGKKRRMDMAVKTRMLSKEIPSQLSPSLPPPAPEILSSLSLQTTLCPPALNERGGASEEEEEEITRGAWRLRGESRELFEVQNFLECSREVMSSLPDCPWDRVNHSH